MQTSIKVKTDKIRDLQKILGYSDIRMAKEIGVTRATYDRAINGGSISARFIAGATVAFRTPFDALFYIETAEQVPAAA
ncbi:hypothetical protein [Corynebacterium pygosceleis]|uniref:hypothetical protein n=1 Tax=Corynebacterium pygosceleis TaxID=2800406 RepID=UPI001903C20A|nr:hypothetical protein [Corynebacterium pygosceleis]MCL0120657.1 hypothetical protein [Corynebacterium pygosceleis]